MTAEHESDAEGIAAIKALEEGYRIVEQTDEYLCVENPDFTLLNGRNPRLVLRRSQLATARRAVTPALAEDGERPPGIVMRVDTESLRNIISETPGYTRAQSIAQDLALDLLAMREYVSADRVHHAAMPHERQRDELHEYAKEITRALTDFVGGGSELFGKRLCDGTPQEMYAADVAFCFKRLRERRQELHRRLVEAKRDGPRRRGLLEAAPSVDELAEAINRGRYQPGGLPYRTLAESDSGDRSYCLRLAREAWAAIRERAAAAQPSKAPVPRITHNPEAGYSELLLKDVPSFEDDIIPGVVVLRRHGDGRFIGVRWPLREETSRD